MTLIKAFGLTFLLTLITGSFTTVSIYFLSDFDSFTNFLEVQHYNNYRYTHFHGVLEFLSRVVAYLIVFSLIKNKEFNWKDNLNYKSYDISMILVIIFIVFGFQFVYNTLFFSSKIFSHFFLNNDKVYHYNFQGFSIDFIHLWIGAIFIAPVFEELLFRKILFKKLKEKYSMIVSLIISSICFSFIHLENPHNLIPSFFFGIISALIYHKTNKIRYSIILHLVYNLLCFSINSIGEGYVNWMYQLEFNYIYWSFFLLGIIVTYSGIKYIYQTK